MARKFAPPANLPGKGPAEEVALKLWLSLFKWHNWTHILYSTALVKISKPLEQKNPNHKNGPFAL
jgi:hypothetical protein